MPRYTDEELYAMEHDLDEWDWDNPIEMPAQPGAGLRIVLRLTSDEVDVLSRAAQAEGTTVHRYMRAAALEKAAHAAANAPTQEPART